MSCIEFRTRSGSARVSGRERARFGLRLTHWSWRLMEEAFGAGGPGGPGEAALSKAVGWPEWVLTGTLTSAAAFMDRARQAMGAPLSGLRVRLPGAEPAGNALDVAINSVVQVGDPVLALQVRMYGQCEAYGWFAAEDRVWLADLIDSARGGRGEGGWFDDAASVNGQYEGWPGVVELLRTVDVDEPVVMSESGGPPFPGRESASWHPGYGEAVPAQCPRDCEDCADLDWAELDDDRQWELSVAGVRHATEELPAMQISSSNLHDPQLTGAGAVTWASVARAWRQAGSG